MSHSRDDDDVLSSFQAWWNVPIKTRIDALLREADLSKRDYATLDQRLKHLSEQERLDCHAFIAMLEAHHKNGLPLSAHELSILGTIYLAMEDYDKAKHCFESVEKDHEDDCAWALNCLGLMYFWGKGIAKDYHKAFIYFQQSDKIGDAAALTNLANMHIYGSGVTQDHGQGFSYCQQAADKGSVRALGSLGIIYINGFGVIQDYQQAVIHLRQGAKKGDSFALGNLGVLCINGRGVPQDREQGIIYLRHAAEKGDVVALLNLGKIYKEGIGITQNDKQAVIYYRQVAEKGNVEALYHLGEMYSEGRGVTKDTNQAAAYCRQAAEISLVNNLLYEKKNLIRSKNLLRQLQINNPTNPTILYHAAIGTQDKELLQQLSQSVEQHPENFIAVASQDSPQKLLATLGEINSRFLIELIIKNTANKITPRFNEIYHALPEMPSDVIAIISSYDEHQEPLSMKQKLKNFFSMANEITDATHEDYINVALERCRVKAMSDSAKAPFLTAMAKQSQTTKAAKQDADFENRNASSSSSSYSNRAKK